jgi:predicted DNA-binding transcriptional regulator YafY
MRFGTKSDKQERLSREIAILKGGETTIEDLARATGVDRATIERDLLAHEENGVPIYEGKRGRVGLADWFFHRRK